MAATPSHPPFALDSRTGPQASARVDARITRSVDGKPVTLPGAIVPALAAGDVVDIRVPILARRWRRNIGFSSAAIRPTGLSVGSRRAVARPPAGLHLRYGTAPGRRGIPIFFIVPEDKKTRGMDGVRDNVDAHRTDLVDMAQSANEAAERYSWFRDFKVSLGVHE